MNNPPRGRAWPDNGGSISNGSSSGGRAASVPGGVGPRPVVTASPAVKGPLAHALDREQQADRYDFAGPRHCLTMLRNILHRVVYLAVQFCDKVFVRHGRSSGGKSVFGQTLTTIAPAHGPARKNQYQWLVYE